MGSGARFWDPGACTAGSRQGAEGTHGRIHKGTRTEAVSALGVGAEAVRVLCLDLGNWGWQGTAVPLTPPQGTRVHQLLGEHGRPSALLRALSCPRGASSPTSRGQPATWERRYPYCPGDRAGPSGHHLPADLSARPPRCSPSSSVLRGCKSSSAQGPPSVQAPHAGTWGRSSGPSGLVLPCRERGQRPPSQTRQRGHGQEHSDRAKEDPRGGPRWVVQTDEVTVVGTRPAPEIPG